MRSWTFFHEEIWICASFSNYGEVTIDKSKVCKSCTFHSASRACLLLPQSSRHHRLLRLWLGHLGLILGAQSRRPSHHWCRIFRINIETSLECVIILRCIQQFTFLRPLHFHLGLSMLHSICKICCFYWLLRLRFMELTPFKWVTLGFRKFTLSRCLCTATRWRHEFANRAAALLQGAWFYWLLLSRATSNWFMRKWSLCWCCLLRRALLWLSMRLFSSTLASTSLRFFSAFTTFVHFFGFLLFRELFFRISSCIFLRLRL